MFKNLYNEEDSLPMEWDFISQAPEKISRNSTTQEGEQNKMLVRVELNAQQRMIQFFKSTLVMDYSLRELSGLIIKEFQLSKTVALKIYVNNRLISNDHVLRLLIQAMRRSSEQPILAIQVTVVEKKMPCILCMKDECEHNATPDITRKDSKDKKRKSEAAPTNNLIINFLEAETVEIKEQKDSNCKKRKTSCRTHDLSLSQDLSLPLVGTFTF